MSKTFIIIYYSNKQLLIKITNQNKKSDEKKSVSRVSEASRVNTTFGCEVADYATR